MTCDWSHFFSEGVHATIHCALLGNVSDGSDAACFDDTAGHGRGQSQDEDKTQDYCAGSKYI